MMDHWMLDGFFFLLGFAVGAGLVWSAVFMAMVLKDEQEVTDGKKQ